MNNEAPTNTGNRRVDLDNKLIKFLSHLRGEYEPTEIYESVESVLCSCPWKPQQFKEKYPDVDVEGIDQTIEEMLKTLYESPARLKFFNELLNNFKMESSDGN